jgi:hypothetical protein
MLRLRKGLAKLSLFALISGFFSFGVHDLAYAAPHAPAISTSSTISNAQVNPTVVITVNGTTDSFSALATFRTDSITVDAGTTSLTFSSISRGAADSHTTLTLNFTGTARPGTVSITAEQGAFTVATTANAASNTLNIGVPQATTAGENFSASASATSITTGDSVTVTVTNTWTSGGLTSRVVAVDSTTTGSGAIQNIYFKNTNDTINALVDDEHAIGVAYKQNASDTAVSAVGPARYNKVVTTVLLQNFSKAGTYYVTLYNSTDSNTSLVANKTVNFTITVTDAAATGINVYTSTDTFTGQAARLSFGASPADSPLTFAAGKPESPTFVAYMYPVVTTLGSYAGDSLTAAGANFCSIPTAGYCSVVASISGPGLLAVGGAGGLAGSKAKSVTLQVSNTAGMTGAGDTLTVFSDGSAGSATITFTMGAVSLGTKSVTFAGTASTITAYYVDTVISKSATAQVAVKALVKDAAGNKLTTGTVYAFSSDTAVISDSPVACTYSTTYAMHSCSITAADTGTASITIRNAATVSGSTIASSALSFTVRGTLVKSVTASFDKATYAPGEKAILTLNAKDVLGNTMDAVTSSAWVITQDKAFSSGTLASTFTPYLATGSETQVVYMPNSGGTFTINYAPGAGAWSDMAAVAITATVVDATKDAADAATDAALEATDAAYAAQDAAQLAAEAADAATAAAEAATAAVDDLATQVAALFADLQKQITTLANVVAKIAKKVKA